MQMDVGVSKNRDIPQNGWFIIYNGKPYLLMDDLGGKPTIFGNILTCIGARKTISSACSGDVLQATHEP